MSAPSQTGSPDDGAALDLTPREPVRARRRRRPMIALVAAILVLAGFVLWKGLAEATLYFYNVDEAVAQRADLGSDRFRIQGTVVPGTLEEAGTVLDFDVSFNGATASVEHTGGSPPSLFREGLPVVLEGHWAGDVFISDADIIVKHDETYEEKNPDRIREADEYGTVPTSGGDGATP